MNRILSLTIIFFSVCGICGLLGGKKWGGYFALPASISQVVLGCYVIARMTNLQLDFAQILQASLAIIVGFAASIMILKSDTSVASYVSSSKNNPKSLIDEYAVKVIDVTKDYGLGPTTVRAIDKINMNVRRGEFLAIMGPSGSGKSTFLNLVGALDRPSSGQILIDGVDLATLDDDGLAQLRNEKIGFVFQAYNLINRSKILRNVELPALVQGLPTNERLMRTHDLLTRVGIDHMADRRPKTLSGGEQQRVAISRALVNNPQIVLADEPTGNLDSTIGSEIINYLKTTSSVKGTTMIIVTHNPEIAEIADRIVYFRDGKIVREVNRS
jgi:putative ABC transport system ATP-binding protein